MCIFDVCSLHQLLLFVLLRRLSFNIREVRFIINAAINSIIFGVMAVLIFLSQMCALVCVVFAGSEKIHWSYKGNHGKHHWADLFPKSCGGRAQSPVNIDLSQTYIEDLEEFTFIGFRSFQGISWDLVNNGHSAQVTYKRGDLVVSGGGLQSPYKVVQFHFHWGSDDAFGSEHTVNGHRFPMEMHIVTYNTKYVEMDEAKKYSDGLAVLGVFFELHDEDVPNMHFARLINALRRIEKPDKEISFPPVALGQLLPANTYRYCRYKGSLTTPPCSEVVTWTLFEDTVKISAAQLAVFRGLKSADVEEDRWENKPLVDNFRPLQPLNGRAVSCNF